MGTDSKILRLRSSKQEQDIRTRAISQSRITIFFAIIILVFLLAIFQKPIFATVDPLSSQNNKFGIHILSVDELEKGARLVNSNGGDWGYVTIPIQSTDRNLEKWQNFMDRARELHIIPIIRIATFGKGETWTKPIRYDEIDWANFLNSLTWPTKNKYVTVSNEVNRANEWNGEVRPDEYAMFLSATIDALKDRNKDFYILNAGFDAAAPNNHILMEERQYLLQMNKAVPGIFKKLDGWASHSYPNPGFVGKPSDQGKTSIKGYQWELDFLQRNFAVFGLKVFITETGWDKNFLGESRVGDFYKEAFSKVWNDDYIVAITPFLLWAGAGDFEKFSFLSPAGEENKLFKTVSSIEKSKGQPELTPVGQKLEPVPSIVNEKSSTEPINTIINIGKETKNFFENVVKIILGL